MILGKFKHTMQEDDYDCGVACINSILRYYNIKTNINTIKKVLNTDVYGTRILNLYEFLNVMGFEPKIFKIKTEKNFEMFKNLKCPTIALMKTNDIRDHYIVIYEISSKGIIYSDPGHNKIQKSKTNLIMNKVKLLIILENDDKKLINTSILPKISNYSINYILTILNDNKKYLIWMFVFSVLMNIFGVVYSYYIGMLIDKIIPGKSNVELNIMTLCFLIIIINKSIFEYIRNKLLIKTGKKIEKTLNLKYISHILDLKAQVFKNRKLGDFITRLNDALILVDMTSNVIVTSIIDLLLIVFSGFLLSRINYKLFCISLIPIVIYILISYFFFKNTYRYNKKVMQSHSNFNSFFLEILNNIEDIKSLNKEKFFNETSKFKIDEYIVKSTDLSNYNNKNNFLKSLINSIFIILILYFGTKQIFYGKLRLGELVTFNTMLAYFFGSIQNIVNLQPDIEQMIVASKRFFSILNFDDVEIIENKFKLIDKIKNLKFSDLSYGFNENIVVENSSLDINENESVLIMGASGVGKSTLAKILVKLEENYSGNITINDIDIKSINTNSLRSKVCYLSNNKFIIEGSIYDNLCLGKDYKENELIKACEHACLMEFINGIPDKWNFNIIENGKNLSLGQIQRILIARVLLNNPDVVIFDESMSNIDDKNKNKIMENLKTYNFIKIFITHDPLINYYDKVYKIENKKIKKLDLKNREVI